MQKKTKRRLIIALLLSPVVLPLVVILLLYIPFVQDFAVQQVSKGLGSSLAMSIKVEEVRLLFPAKIKVLNLEFAPKKQEHNQPSGAIISGKVEALSCKLSLSPLLSKRLSLKDIDVKNLSFYYQDSLKLTTVSARLKALSSNMLEANLKKEIVLLDVLSSEGLNVNYHALNDTTSKEETEALKWQIQANKIELLENDIALAMPEANIYFKTKLSSVSLSDSKLKLEDNGLDFERLGINAPELSYQRDLAESSLPYLDYEHLNLRDVHLLLTNLEAHKGEKARLLFDLEEASFRETSGFVLNKLEAKARIDKEVVALEDLALETEHSFIKGKLELPWKLLSNKSLKDGFVLSEMSLSPQDIYLLSGIRLSELALDKGLERKVGDSIPNKSLIWSQPIKADVKMIGSLEDLYIQHFHLNWDNVLSSSIKGQVHKLRDEKKRNGNFNLSLICEDKANILLGFVGSPDVAERCRIPKGLNLKGDMLFNPYTYKGKLSLKEGGGLLDVKAKYRPKSTALDCSLAIDSLNLKHFLPLDSLGLVQAKANVKTNSLDFERTEALQSEVRLQIDELNYINKKLKAITLEGLANKGELSLSINSLNKGLDFSLLFDGLLHKGGLATSLNFNVQDIDAHYWEMSAMPLSAKFSLEGDYFSNLKEQHHLELKLDDIKLQIDDKKLQPKELLLKFKSSQALCQANLTSGDLLADLKVGSSVGEMQNHLDALLTAFNHYKEEVLSAEALKRKEEKSSLRTLVEACPKIDFNLQMGKQNALRPYLAEYRLATEEAHLAFSSSKEKGLSASMSLAKVRSNALRIDSITARLSSEDWQSLGKESLALAFKVDKDPFRKQAPFHLKAKLNTNLWQMALKLKLLGQEKTLQDLELLANWQGQGIEVKLPQKEIILAEHLLEVNPDNYLRLNKKTKLLGAKLNLLGANREAVYISAVDSIKDKQIVNLRLNQINLNSYTSLFLSGLEGSLSAELSYEREGDLTALPIITGDVSINKLSYEGKDLGYFSSSVFYQPRNDSSHYITAEVAYAGLPCLSIDGIYRPNQTNEVETKVAMTDFPLILANPFLSSYNIALRGTTKGHLDIMGKLGSLNYNGVLSGNKAGIDFRAYSSMFDLDKQDIKIDNGRIVFNNYALLSQANPNNTINLNGFCNLLDKRGIETDISIKADKLLLFDTKAKRDDIQLLYGKLLASANLRLLGLGQDIRLRGNLSVDAGTDCHYIMSETPLQLSDNMSDVVSFSDFADTLFRAEPIILDNQESGTDINIGIVIDPSVTFGVDLSPNGTDFLETSGGGKLQLSSPPYGDMKLVGRYEMSGNGGKLRYTLPIVGQRTFTIDKSSFLAFDGDAMNPNIKLKADYTMKASTKDDRNNKTAFIVSIVAKDRLDDLKLSFDLSAPENLKVQNAIRRMTEQERGKQALALLTTGVYLAGGSDNLNNALTAILESRLNAVTNSILKDTDISLGMELNNGANGGNAYTNYTYSFSKRFYNDRLKFIVGGKIQVGNNKSQREQSFIDNVAIQYQLDKKAEQYLKAYYKRVLDDIMEGDHTETGLGYLMRRKLRRFSDIFRFKPKKKAVQSKAPAVQVSSFTLPLGLPAEVDSVQTAEPIKALGEDIDDHKDEAK